MPRDEYLNMLAVVVLLVAFFLLLPAKYDPAVWLADWLQKKGRRK